MTKFLIFMFICLITTQSFVSQTTHYFSSSEGNDKNVGTSSRNPWKTVSKANGLKLNPGDSVLFKTGDTFGDIGLIISQNGSEDNPIVFGAYGNKAKPIMGNESWTERQTLLITAKNIAVENLFIWGTFDSRINKGSAIRIESSSNILITKCEIKGNDRLHNISQSRGIGISKSNKKVRIVKNLIHEFSSGIESSNNQEEYISGEISYNKVMNIYCNKDRDSDGIRVVGGGKNIPVGERGADLRYLMSIHHNEITKWGEDAIDVCNVSNIIVEYNHIHHGLTNNGNVCRGIKMGCSTSFGNIFRYNTIHDLWQQDPSLSGSDVNWNSSAMGTEHSLGGKIYGNLVYNIYGWAVKRDGNDDFIENYKWEIYNNTFITGSTGIYVEAKAVTSTVIYNNIISSGSRVANIHYPDDWRGVDNGGIYDIQQRGNCSGGNNMLVNDEAPYKPSWASEWTTTKQQNLGRTSPLFVNESNHDYSLKSNSPAIDAGTISDVTQDILGNQIAGKHDIGAFEYTGLQSSNTQTHFTPSIVGQPVNQNGNAGQNITFTVDASCSDEIGYQWRKYPVTTILLNDGNKYTGTKTNSLTINNISEQESGSQYICEVYNKTNHGDLWINSDPAELIVSSIDERLTVFLEGAYIQNNKMKTMFNSSESFPIEQPYNTTPWNFEYESKIQEINNTIVDWLIVELRDELNQSLYRKPGILTTDGTVINSDGSKFSFQNIKSGDYYIVIIHRNHLSIISQAKTPITKVVNYDFSAAMNKAYGSNSLVNLGNGNFGMIAGDGDSNGIINNLDFGVVANNIPFKGYHHGDLDFSGSVNVLDYSLINKNIFKHSKAPK